MRKLFRVIIRIRVSVNKRAIVRFRDMVRVRVRVRFRIMVRVKLGSGKFQDQNKEHIQGEGE